MNLIIVQLRIEIIFDEWAENCIHVKLKLDIYSKRNQIVLVYCGQLVR